MMIGTTRFRRFSCNLFQPLVLVALAVAGCSEPGSHVPAPSSAIQRHPPTFANARNDFPNVIVFLSDDQGWGDFSFVGNPNLSTPNIDALVDDGVLFENFFVCPVCSPTRAEFLTGRYHVRSGVAGTGGAGRERLDLDERTIAEALQAAGYKTAAFGKWHNGTQAPYHPNSRGFDYFYGFCSGHWGNYFSPMLEENGEIVRGQGFAADDFTNRAMEFIEANQDDPFFVYLVFRSRSCRREMRPQPAVSSGPIVFPTALTIPVGRTSPTPSVGQSTW